MPKFLTIILISISINIKVLCEPISEEQLNIIVNSFHNNVEKKYEEASQFLSNGTVTKFNLPYRIKLYSLKLDIYRMERIIEKLKNKKGNDSQQSEEYYKNEKIFFNGYRHLLKIIEETNDLYNKAIRMIKKLFFIIIGIILIGGIIALLIMVYISKYKLKDYQSLVDKKDKKNKFQIVEIFNNILNFNKKIK